MQMAYSSLNYGSRNVNLGVLSAELPASKEGIALRTAAGARGELVKWLF